MVTSGTTGQTLLDVAQVIEHAFRRATGGMVSTISAEQLQTARENLFLGLSAFANKGLSLWCVKTLHVPTVEGKRTYTLPPGVQDLLTVVRRDGTFTDADILALGSATLTYSEDTQVDSVVLALPAGTDTWLLESSPDGATWTERGSYSGTLTAAGSVVIDAELQATELEWRVRQTVGASTPTDVRFVNNSREIEMTLMARDEYEATPNKLALGTPVQYRYDKQFAAPKMTVWQVPSTDDMLFVLNVQESVEDVGDFTNNLGVPARWLDAIISDLTVRTYMELPKAMTNERVTLAEFREMAAEKLSEASNSETDGGPTYIMPDISAYTR